MNGPPLRVVKLGGSLLEWPPLVPRLRLWRESQAPVRDVFVVGGGRLADAIRAIDREQRLGDETAHWLAIRAMSIAARVVASLLPEMTLVSNPNEVAMAEAPFPVVLDPREFLEQDALTADPLPADWSATSDSIAARLACRLEAAELVLLKSRSPEATDCSGAAREGYVDPFFPRPAEDLTVRWVNLRSSDLDEGTLQG